MEVPTPALKKQKKNQEPLRVLVCDPLDQAGMDILSSFAQVDSRLKLSEDELCDVVGDYDAVMVRSGTTVTEKVIGRGRKLKIIGRAGVGVDNVSVEAATARGVYVVNSPNGNTVAAAELTLGLLMSLARKIPLADASVARGEWTRGKFMGRQLNQKTLGVIGLGQVGTHVARVCIAMGMEVLAYDPFITEEKAKALGCKNVSLDTLLSSSDFITLHVPLLPHTRHLINAEKIRLIKKGACIINAARGGVVDEEALADALMKDHLGGAALDVFEVEKEFSKQNPLIVAKEKGKNIILTPHIGASTFEAQHNVAVDVALQLKEALQGGVPWTAVNLQCVRSHHVANYVHLAEVLGRLGSKLVDEPVRILHLKVRGSPVKSEDADVLLLSAAQGMLRTRCDHVVNFVNVKRIADEHKLELIVSKEEPTVPQENLDLELTLKTKSASASLEGCCAPDGSVVLRKFLGTPIYLQMPSRRRSLRTVGGVKDSCCNGDATANGMEEGAGDSEEALMRPVYMMYTLHSDTAGTLAQVAQKLADAGVNVANCHLGRRMVADASAPGGKAMVGLCIFHADSEIDESVVKSILKLSHVWECKVFATPQSLGLDVN